MAQKSSRSKKGSGRGRGGDPKKQPQLRTGGGRAAKAQRSREREAAATRSSAAGPLVRIRPKGPLGYVLLIVLGWLGAAGVVVAGLLLERWNLVSYPDSLWLYAAFGGVAVAPAIGAFARSRADVDSWAAQVLLLPLGMLVAERFLGPECPPGGDCAVVGARGSLGLTWSVVVLVALAIAAWLLARWTYGRALNSRPRSGRVRVLHVSVALAASIIFLGAPIAAAFVGVDMLTRKTPGAVEQAKKDVANLCFDLGAAPALAVRPAPEGQFVDWKTFAVRRADETRPGVGKRSLPENWATYDAVHPYEAVASYNGSTLASLNCRKIDPASGNATAEDLKPNEPASNPMDPATTGAQFRPNFYTQGPHKPTEEEKKAAAAAAKTAAAKTKADAAKAAKK